MKYNFRTLVSILFLLLISYSSKGISYQSSYATDTSYKQTIIAPKLASVPAFGRKFCLREKVLFFISKSVLKRKHSNSPSQKKVSIEKLERNVHLGFIFSLFSYIMPLLIIPAIILRHKANKHKNQLSDNSRRKLKFIKIVGYFWLITTILAVLIVAAINSFKSF